MAVGADLAAIPSVLRLAFKILMEGAIGTIWLAWVVPGETAKSLDGSPVGPAQSGSSMQGKVRTTNAKMNKNFAVILTAEQKQS